jgi:hypothetical protein
MTKAGSIVVKAVDLLFKTLYSLMPVSMFSLEGNTVNSVSIGVVKMFHTTLKGSLRGILNLN